MLVKRQIQSYCSRKRKMGWKTLSMLYWRRTRLWRGNSFLNRDSKRSLVWSFRSRLTGILLTLKLITLFTESRKDQAQYLRNSLSILTTLKGQMRPTTKSLDRTNRLKSMIKMITTSWRPSTKNTISSWIKKRFVSRWMFILTLLSPSRTIGRTIAPSLTWKTSLIL